MNCIFRASLFAGIARSHPPTPTHFLPTPPAAKARVLTMACHTAACLFAAGFRHQKMWRLGEVSERHTAPFHHFSFCEGWFALFLAGGGKLVHSPRANQLSAIIYSEYTPEWSGFFLEGKLCFACFITTVFYIFSNALQQREGRGKFEFQFDLLVL